MKTTTRVAEPKDVLAAIPNQLGFVPRNSLVVVSLRGAEQRIGLMARCDLAQIAGPSGHDIAYSLVEHTIKDGAQSVFLALYFDHGLETASVFGRMRVGDSEVAEQAHQALGRFAKMSRGRLDIAGTWLVGPETYCPWIAWSNMFCAAHCGAPCSLGCEADCAFECDLHESSGAIKFGSVADLQVSAEGPRSNPVGLKFHNTSQQVAVADTFSRGYRDKMGASYRRHLERLDKARSAKEVRGWELETLDDWINVLDQAGLISHNVAQCRARTCQVARSDAYRGEPATPIQLGKIAAGLAHRRVRDAILLSLTANGLLHATEFLHSALDICGCGSAEPGQCLICPSPKTDAKGESMVQDTLAMIISEQRGVPPINCQVRLAEQVLGQLVANLRRISQAPAHTLLCLIWWWRGSEEIARHYNDLALAQDPNYQLAKLLQSALEAGLKPGWVRRNELLA